MNRPKKGQTSGGKGGGGFNMFGGLLGKNQGDQGQDNVKFQQPTLNATDEAGQPTTIPNSAYNPNAPAYPTQKSFMGLWNYTPSSSKNLASTINTGIGTQVATQNALQPGALAGKQKELQIQANQERENQKYADSQLGASTVRLHMPVNGQIQNGGLSTIPGGSTQYNEIGQDVKNQYGNLLNAGQGQAPSALESTIAGNKNTAARSLYDTTMTQAKQPYASTIGGLQGQGDIQTLLHGLAQGQLQNKVVNDPNYQASFIRGQTAQAGEPAVRKVGPGEGVYDPNLGVVYQGSGTDTTITEEGGVEYPPGSGKMIGGKPMQVHKYRPGSVNPFAGVPTRVNPAGKAALQGMPDDSEKYGFPVPRDTTIQAPLPTTIQDLIGRIGAPTMQGGKLESKINPQEKTPEEKQAIQEDALRKLKEILGRNQNQY